MRIKELCAPASRDPFVNVRLINAGVDPKTGEERFWTSTWNANVGCLGALVTEDGKERIYRFKKANDGFVCCGAYSACLTDNDTIWMMGDLKAFVKLTISTGEYEIFQTGAPEFTMISTGAMQYDANTGKIMAIAFASDGIKGVSYDINAKKTVKIHEDFSPATSCFGSFPNGDGTYTFRFNKSETALYQWNPVEETLIKRTDIVDKLPWDSVITDDSGHVYIPHMGWLDTQDYSFRKENMPEHESIWFARWGEVAYGYTPGELGNEIYSWDMSTGKVQKICQIRDYGRPNMTNDGHIINVSIAGELSKYTRDGELVFAKMLDSNSCTITDCIIKVDDRTIVGTPFITQRFWVMDIEKGEVLGEDRVTPGAGEVLRCWNVDGKIYMATYSDGYLAEYDPKKAINYPENPKVVAKAPAMRPIADAQKGDVIYYASTNKYGELGCTITRYDTQNGEALHRKNPMHAQHILSMYYSKDEDVIIAGTTYISDCSVTPMESDECYILKIHPETLEVLDKIKAPAGCFRASVYGAIDEKCVLISYTMENETLIGSMDVKSGDVTLFKETFEIFGSCIRPTYFLEIKLASYMNEPGRFVMKTQESVLLCKASKDRFEVEKTIFDDKDIYMFSVSGGSIYAITPTKLYIADDVDEIK